MLRHRSCTNPVPRFGGKVCPGEDFEEYPCNTHNCQRELILSVNMHNYQRGLILDVNRFD